MKEVRKYIDVPPLEPRLMDDFNERFEKVYVAQIKYSFLYHHKAMGLKDTVVARVGEQEYQMYQETNQEMIWLAHLPLNIFTITNPARSPGNLQVLESYGVEISKPVLTLAPWWHVYDSTLLSLEYVR